MKNYLMVIHRFNDPGYNLFEVKPKYKAVIKRCHGLTTLKEDKDIKILLSNLYKVDKKGDRFDLVPEHIREKMEMGGVDCLGPFGTPITEINGRDGEFALSVLYWDIAPPEVQNDKT